MATPPAKPNFTRPQGASTPKLSVMIGEERRRTEGLSRKYEELQTKITEIDDGLDALQKDLEKVPVNRQAVSPIAGDGIQNQGLEAGRDGNEVRRSDRNKGKKIDYYKERHPEGPE
jgi:hypothetical protein